MHFQCEGTISTSLANSPTAQKRALLIGINALSSPTEEYGFLQGPHRDVADMKALLTKNYGYQEQNIEVLIDDGIAGHLQPDRQSIIHAIDSLVRKTRSGDSLFFHYSGHTIQVPNQNNPEEDGMDECLVPLDGESRMITNHELRAHLVDTLPAGASLVAVFDSCHSVSLLDLEHMRCNRVFVPWISRVKRNEDEARTKLVPHIEIPVSPNRPRSSTSRTPLGQSPRNSPTRLRARRTSVDVSNSPALSPRSHLYPSSPLSPLKFTSFTAANSNMNPDSMSMAAPSSPRISYRKSNIPAPLKLWDNNKENFYGQASMTGASKPLSPTLYSAISDTGTVYESPLTTFCEGWCRAENTCVRDAGVSQVANVISLGSCKDAELSWENPEGVGMTQALIQILTNDPHPTLKDLVTQLSHLLHGFARDRHQRANAWKKYSKAHAIKSTLSSFDTKSFQHPQISSHRPLDMEAEWFI
ncbi:peptidase C14, caspase domain-containing protein [Favolaschia claudopus]|uniref:Peptidase C14, caspase domain-containing protein n=1 Tax=Favolaschia claudopus TaxID=2862362 RepID=A0AAW0A0P1_9AGAR